MRRIVVLTRNPESYSAQRFAHAAAKLDGVELALTDPHSLYLGLLDGTPSVARLMEGGGKWDCVIPRLGGTATEYSLFALKQLELAGTACLNTHSALSRLRYKFDALSELGAAGLRVPDTMMLRAPGDIGAAVERLGGYPVVLKFIRGSQGVGVVYADNASVAQSVLEALNLIQYDVLVQRFYPAAARGDLRVLVLGGQQCWAIERTAPGEDFRANFHRGGSIGNAEPAPEVLDLALAAARLFGLGFAGVDLVRDGAGGWMVMEVNGSPGFEAVEQVHGKVVAEAVLSHIADRTGS